MRYIVWGIGVLVGLTLWGIAAVSLYAAFRSTDHIEWASMQATERVCDIDPDQPAWKACKRWCEDGTLMLAVRDGEGLHCGCQLLCRTSGSRPN